LSRHSSSGTAAGAGFTRHASRLVVANPYRQRDGIQALSNNALAAAVNIVVRMCAANQPGGRLAHYRRNSVLVEADFPEFRLGFGLHIGYAVEGAIGTHLKIDASYLSPSVNATARLESATRMYDVDIIVSEQFAQCLSAAAQNTLRLIDRVLLKGVASPMSLFTFDWDRATALSILRGGGGVPRPAPAAWVARHALVSSQMGLAAAIGNLDGAGSVDGIRELLPASSPGATTDADSSSGAVSFAASPAVPRPALPRLSIVASPASPPAAAPPPSSTAPPPATTSPLCPPRIAIPLASHNSGGAAAEVGGSSASPTPVFVSRATSIALPAATLAAQVGRAPGQRHQRRIVPYVHMDTGGGGGGDTGLRDAMGRQLITELSRLQPESAYPTAFFEHAEAAVGYYVGDPTVDWEAARQHARLALELRPRDGPLTMQLAYMDKVGVGESKSAPPWWQGYRPFDSK